MDKDEPPKRRHLFYCLIGVSKDGREAVLKTRMSLVEAISAKQCIDKTGEHWITRVAPDRM